jgi:hypothetical protein
VNYFYYGRLPMNKQQRDDFRAIHEATTGGKWYLKLLDAYKARIDTGEYTFCARPRDAAFIAAAREALPALLDDADRMEEELAQSAKMPEIDHGDTVYWIWGNILMPCIYLRLQISRGNDPDFQAELVVATKKKRVVPVGWETRIIKAGDIRYLPISWIGKTVFLTRAEAEAAMRKRGGGE